MSNCIGAKGVSPPASEPKIVQLDQNRVDLVFEIFEGDKSKVRRINIIGNNEFPDDRLRKEMYTRQAGGPLGFMKSNDSYDPDRLAADQQKLRAYYLTQGYADFRVVSALAELTPDRRDFIITYVVEEGPRYKFGTSKRKARFATDPESQGVVKHAREGFTPRRRGYGFRLTELAATRAMPCRHQPGLDRDVESVDEPPIPRRETPRVYVERINIQGNT